APNPPHTRVPSACRPCSRSFVQPLRNELTRPPSFSPSWRMVARFGTPARRASIAPRASIGGRFVMARPRSASDSTPTARGPRADCRGQSRGRRPTPAFQGVIGVERSFGVFAGERIVREHDNEQTFESLGVVDQLAQHLERVDHSRRGVTNTFAGDAHSAKDLTNVERDANPRALAKPQPPA